MYESVNRLLFRCKTFAVEQFNYSNTECDLIFDIRAIVGCLYLCVKTKCFLFLNSSKTSRLLCSEWQLFRRIAISNICQFPNVNAVECEPNFAICFCLLNRTQARLTYFTRLQRFRCYQACGRMVSHNLAIPTAVAPARISPSECNIVVQYDSASSSLEIHYASQQHLALCRESVDLTVALPSIYVWISSLVNQAVKFGVIAAYTGINQAGFGLRMGLYTVVNLFCGQPLLCV